mmetsp:Transcript_3013/g.12179  ORF Transcript_3013/g.12179 Transcript_3013/m.12179 type:complete len:308 (+) Transcript_3013:404-1327(+)
MMRGYQMRRVCRGDRQLERPHAFDVCRLEHHLAPPIGQGRREGCVGSCVRDAVAPVRRAVAETTFDPHHDGVALLQGEGHRLVPWGVEICSRVRNGAAARARCIVEVAASSRVVGGEVDAIRWRAGVGVAARRRLISVERIVLLEQSAVPQPQRIGRLFDNKRSGEDAGGERRRQRARDNPSDDGPEVDARAIEIPVIRQRGDLLRIVHLDTGAQERGKRSSRKETPLVPIHIARLVQDLVVPGYASCHGGGLSDLVAAAIRPLEDLHAIDPDGDAVRNPDIQVYGSGRRENHKRSGIHGFPRTGTV